MLFRSDIAAGSEWSATSATTYTFEGVRTIAKAERDTSYSGVGYLKITMQDDTVVYVYSDYVKRNHAFALSDLVEMFHDVEDDTPNQGTDSANTQTNENNGTSSPDDTAETAKAKKKGCGSTVLGAGAVMMVAILGSACVFTRKKKED